MAKPRTLWKVTQGWTRQQDGPSIHKPSVQRPESRAKTYRVYVPDNVNEARAREAAGLDRYDHTQVWIDERDGRGWRLYETIPHRPEGA